MSPLSVLHLFREDLTTDEAWRLVRWCLERGADEFTLHGILVQGAPDTPFKAFDTLADPHRKPDATRHQMTGQTTAVELWTLNEATLNALELAVPRGIFDYDPRPGAWFEDLTLYRAGELMLGIVTHEGEGVLRLEPTEIPQFRNTGFVSRPQGEWVDFAV